MCSHQNCDIVIMPQVSFSLLIMLYVLCSSIQEFSPGMEQKHRCLDAINPHWLEYLLNTIKDTPPESLTEHGLLARNPGSCGIWVKGSITLLGDAEHLTTLYSEQGQNQSFIDAVEVGRAISYLGACDKALRQYEHVWIEAIKPVLQGSWAETDGLLTEREGHAQSPWRVSQKVKP